MDIPRPSPSRRRPLILWSAGTLAILALTVGLARLRPAAPSIDPQSVLVDTVKRGPMVFQVRGTGTLVPVEVRILTAQTPCKVERLRLLPGSEVKPDSIIAELTSPELQQGVQESYWNLRRAEADYEVGYLNQKGLVASAKAAAREAESALVASRRLRQEGLVSEQEMLRAQTHQEDTTARLATEQARLALYESRAGALAPARAALEQARAQHQLKRQQEAALLVRAGMDGVLQQMPLQVGQQLTPGAVLAKVARSLPLKAELRISETQAKDLQVGQKVDVDTRNGIVPGRLLRIDPAVQNGTVTVDAELSGPLPKGARPDLSVEGIIELDRADNGLFVGRPVQAQAYGTLSLFRLTPDGAEALRVKVRLGRGSVSSIEILDGLQPGDRVILSDTTAWDGVDRIRLK